MDAGKTLRWMVACACLVVLLSDMAYSCPKTDPDIVQSATKEKRDALIPFPEADEETPVVGVQDTRSHHQVHRHLPAVSRAERENIGDDGARDQTEENRKLVEMLESLLTRLHEQD